MFIFIYFFMEYILMNDIKLLELCKNQNINYNELKEYFKLHKNKEDLVKSLYEYVLSNFINSNTKNIEKNINCLKLFIPYLNQDLIYDIKNEINKKSEQFVSYKYTVSLLKSFSIYINKYFLDKNIDNDNNNRILSLISCIENTNNIKRIIFNLKRLLKYYIVHHNTRLIYEINNIDKIIDIVNNKIKNLDNKHNKHNIFYLYKFINIIKYYHDIDINKSDLEKIIKTCDKKYYNYVYFLNNDDIINSKEESLKFISKIGYHKKNFEEIDVLNLKRGFIQGINSGDNDYLLKYQPNKSIMEIFINCYLRSLVNHKKITETSDIKERIEEKIEEEKLFLLPSHFFINSDNSYFYIIQKYQSDLNKYFNKLIENNILINFDNILHIIYFLIKSTHFLHKNKIIHADLKLENIVINYDSNYNITDIKIIDFDISVFDAIPSCLNKTYKPFIKKFNNKKQRGTRIYMIKHDIVTFKNDIFSIGVISMILLYKMIKIIISSKKHDEKNQNILIKYQNIIKKINILKNKLEENNCKIKMMNLLEKFYKNNIYDDGNFNKFDTLKLFILDCINVNKNNMDIYKLSEKYGNQFSSTS